MTNGQELLYNQKAMAEVKCIKNHLQNFEKNSGIATGENRISITQNEQKKKQKHQKTYVLQLN